MSLVKLAVVLAAAQVAAALWFVCDRAPGTAAALVGLPLDDAWIHMVYARSLAALQGFAYNPGELETGSSSPLWAGLLVPASLVARLAAISVVLPAKITGVLVATGASLGAARLARALGHGNAVELGCGLVVAIEPSLAFAAVSGMEILLAGGIVLWAFAALSEKRLRTASVLAALAPLARPELVLLTILVLIVVERDMHLEKKPWAARLAVLIPTFSCVGGWMLYCFLVSGYPLPNTFYAKFSSRQDFLAHNLGLLVGHVTPSWTFFSTGVGFLLWALGAIVLCRSGLLARLIATFPLLFLLAVCSSQLIREPSPFYWQRYFLPALPLLLVTMVIGVAHAVGWALQQRTQRLRVVLTVAAALASIVACAGLPGSLRDRAHLYAWNCQNIQELNVAMAMWLRDHAPVGETLAVTDAGAARYFSDRRVFDALGLNNHGFLHGRAAGASELAHIGTVVTFPALLPALRGHADWQVLHRVSAPHLTICDCPQSELVAYRRETLPAPARR